MTKPGRDNVSAGLRDLLPHRPPTPVLTFLGAAQTVTGSKHLVDTPTARVLVDCGLFQGRKSLRLRNWEPLPVPAASIDAVLITHAHLDHVGYLPALVRDGFAGPILATQTTIELARIVLPDSARLQEEEAAFANRHGYSKHSPARPLYTESDARRALKLFRAVDVDRPVAVAPGIAAEWRIAGHILGACSILVHVDGRTVLFSGDLGRPEHPVLVGPAPPAEANLIVCESTYGDRGHSDEEALERFRDALATTIRREGTVVIPAFAVDRTEVVLHHLRRLVRSGDVPAVPVFVDSPMASSALAVYRRAIAERAPGIKAGIAAEPDPFDPGHLIETPSVGESKAINAHRGPSIIVASSGMATGGRVLHHLKRHLPNPNDTVILAGFQAHGTRGHLLATGERAVKMHGRYVPVHARVANIPAFSVHADRNELLSWMRLAPREPETLFLVHGEPEAAVALRDAASAELGWTAAAPNLMERIRLGGSDV